MEQAQEISNGQGLSDGQEEGFPDRQKATVPVELTVGAVSEACKPFNSTEPQQTVVAAELPGGASPKTCSPSEYRADVVGFLDLPGEMRNRIYNCIVQPIYQQDPSDYHGWHRPDGVATGSAPITYAYLTDEHCCSHSSNWQGLLSLASTCKIVLRELVPLVAKKVQCLKTDVASFVKFLDSHPVTVNLLLEEMSTRKSTIQFVVHGGNYDRNLPIQILPALQALKKFDDLKVETTMSHRNIRHYFHTFTRTTTTADFMWLFRFIRNHPSWMSANLKRLHVLGVGLAEDQRFFDEFPYPIQIFLDREATQEWWDDTKKREQRVKQLLSNLQLFRTPDQLKFTDQHFHVDVYRGVSLLEAERCPRPGAGGRH